ncbi:Symplekin tight junction protein C terminal-domain-containing protein [Radiomyces spectabilis]|uniref:Symplekin tight junction protein C terminal-domain-containing protein n=1 Tax=Radiomyces spectabilis TaxID=64574 RepID=UPI002220EE83|nr:Symplekin tight junction protein C terminal-domain-containing protein [Radiomyces spectabilis]KAI8393729.1 Symplekin tight junction protein C terminal-domain-containing protein [Radiomyces spectabilis]
MDYDQQLAQLQEFDQEVLAHPTSAQVYATNAFLDALTEVINTGLAKADEDVHLRTLKDAIRAFATVLPHIFKTVCQNEAETRMWQTTTDLITIVREQLFDHPNTGVKINATKCLQVLIVIQSRSERTSVHDKNDVSLSLIRPDHRLLNVKELEQKGQEMFNMLVDRLKANDGSEPVLTATVQSLVPLAKKRTQLTPPIMETFVAWSKTVAPRCSPIIARNVDKAIKLAFVAMIRSEPLASYRTELIQAFGSVGGNTAMFQSRQARLQEREQRERERREGSQEETKRKRALATVDGGQEKKSRVAETTAAAPSNANILANFDVTTLPLPMVVDICLAVFHSVSMETLVQNKDSLVSSSGQSASQVPEPVEPMESTTPTTTPPPMPTSTDPLIKQEDTLMADTKLLTVDEKDTKRVPLASVQERASQALKMQPYELAAPSSLSYEDQRMMLKSTIQRIFESETMLQQQIPKAVTEQVGGRPIEWRTPAKTVWLLLVAKLLTRGTVMPANGTESSGQEEDTDMTSAAEEQHQENDADELKQMLLDFIISDFQQRHGLALDWLYEEFQCDTLYKKGDPHYKASYFKWLHRLLEAAIAKLDIKDKSLNRVLASAPALDQKVIDILRQHMEEEPSHFVWCVATLRDIIQQRPPVRDPCLDVLLNLCISADVKTRSTSIVAVKKWVPDHPVIARKVEQYAIESLQELKTAQLKEVQEAPQDTGEDSTMTEAPEEEAQGWTEQDVVRHAELYFALCVKKHELLHQLFDVYIHASDRIQRLIRLHIFNLIKSVGMQSPIIINLVKEFPPGAETLVIRILVILCDTVRPTPELVSAVKSVYQERRLDAKFLIPIISGLSKEDIRHNLPRIVDLLNNTEGQRNVVKKVFSRSASSTNNVKAPMSPSELLLALHEMDEDVPLPKAVEAINICFTMPETFEPKFVATALQQLIERPRIPLLFMVTMIRTVSVYKNLINVILNLLQKLISKRVWTYPKLWDGFVKCVEKSLPDSVKIAVHLPKEQLQEILTKVPKLQTPLREFAEKNGKMAVLVKTKKERKGPRR